MNNMVKNVMYILNSSTMGGAAYSLLDMLKEIIKYVNPTVIMPVATEAKPVFEALNIHCYEVDFAADYVKIGEVTAEKQETDYKQSYEAALQLLPIIEKEKIQLIHINSSTSYFGAIAALIAKIPYIYHIRELMEEQFGCEFINTRIKQELYARADEIIAISEYVRQKYYEKYSVNAKKIYNGIDIQKYKLKLNTGKEFKNIFLAAAAISYGKGQLDAVHAAEILLQKGYSDIKLVIVGSGGGYSWALNKYIKIKGLEKNIKILPFQSDLSELHRQTSYALTCSQHEALGRVTIEAMLGGNIVIGADSGGTTEIIGRDESRGFLYELHNSAALADAMVKAMRCPDEMKRQMMFEAQEYAEKTFENSGYCREILKVYDDVISSFRCKADKIFLDELKEKYELIANKKAQKKQNDNSRSMKAETAFSLSIKWLEIKQNGHSLSEYFKGHGFESVAIYGMAFLGCRLYDELENSGIKVKHLLDQKPGDMARIMKFDSISRGKITADVIVVTVAASERKIVEEIKAYGYGNVVGLSDILNELSIAECTLDVKNFLSLNAE